MARGDEPLLARRPSSDLSEDRGIEEEDELLTGQHRESQHQRWQKWRERGLYAYSTLATLVVIILAVLYQNGRSQQKHDDDNINGKRNLIFMVSDGMGPTSLSLTRSFRQYQSALPFDDALTLDAYIIGQSRTRSTSSLITDSAAGATAFSCGQKSYNGAISVLPDHLPCGTVMEAAKKAGYMTGLVVTTRITDATPACFASHVYKRDQEDRIAEQLLGDYPLGRTVDLMLGAGRCHFLSNTTEGSCREDDKDLVKQAKNKGFTYIDSRKGFDDLQASGSIHLPLLGLFADHDIPYDIDRKQENDVYPSLAEMATTAMKALADATKDNEKGFFLMVEGSRIDHAGHANDPVAQVHEVLAYDDTFKAVLSFLEKDSVQGVMVSTSDHETGGLATAKQLKPYEYPKYLWHPSVLANASHSVAWLSHEYSRHLHENKDDEHSARSFLKTSLPQHLGINDCSSEEMDLLISQPQYAPYSFADMISRRSQTGWSSHGHSAADVNIYASQPSVAKKLGGSRENTEVGNFLSEYLGVEVEIEKVTGELKKKGSAWMGHLPHENERLDGQSHEIVMDHYEGDHRRHKRCDLCGLRN